MKGVRIWLDFVCDRSLCMTGVYTRLVLIYDWNRSVNVKAFVLSTLLLLLLLRNCSLCVIVVFAWVVSVHDCWLFINEN